jgi:RecB family exonuclease
MTDPFVDQLADLCRQHVTRAKWVFVPAHGVGHTIGERIALGGTNWLNLRFVTPLDVALRMGAPFLVERGIEPSEEGLGPALMMRLLLALPASAPESFGEAGPVNGYFRPLAEQPTLAQALWTTLRELRMAGITSAAFAPVGAALAAAPAGGTPPVGAALAWPAEAAGDPAGRRRPAAPAGGTPAAKHAELRALLEAYERFLADHNRADMAAVYEEAVKHPDWCPIQPQDCWTELPDTLWSPLQRRLMDTMPGERIAPRALTVPGATVPRRLAGSGSVRLQADPAAHPLAFLMNPGNAQRDERCTLGLFHAGGREAEVEEVIRRILSSRAPLDQVEVACASSDHVGLLWEKALRHEWPVTLGPGIPAASTRPGRALLGFCDWIETDFSAGHLRRLLQSGDMGIEADDEGFTASQAARTIAKAEAGWGRETYRLSLGALRKSYESRANDPDLEDDERKAAIEKAELTGKVQDWVDGLIAAIPTPAADNTVPLQDVVTAAVAYAERSTARVSKLDHVAGKALKEQVAELRSLGDFRCTLEAALRFVRERVQSLNVAADRPRPGHLYACTLSQAGFSGRPHLYIVGLEEGRVFPVASEDPVLLDAERAAISPALRLSTDRIDEAVYTALSRLAVWSGQINSQSPTPNSQTEGAHRSAPSNELGVGNWDLGVDSKPAVAPAITFSYSCRDTREFRETYASWLMLQAFRLQQAMLGVGSWKLGVEASYPDMKDALSEPVSSVPQDREGAATAAAWWLRSVVSTGDKGVAVVEGSFAALKRGREADEQRASAAFTEFDGYVPAAGAALDPCASHSALSVTELEKAAACPYRFFMKRGLGLRPVDDGERDRDVWLDPLTRGSVLHDIYASLLRRCHAATRRPDLKMDGAWLTALAQGELDRLNREMPPATAEILERESREFLADVELFLEAEAEATGTQPIGFEVSFGRPLGEDEDSLASAEPVEIELGDGLTFRIAGRIDRIDKVGASEFRILDYKTGGFWRDDWKGVFSGGRRLQHALYGLAAVALLRKRDPKAKVTGAQYYFPSRKGRRERVTIKAPKPEQTAAVLADLRELIVQGAFIQAADKKACKWCDYEAACTDEVHERAAQKLGDPKLVAFGRLAAHE